ncbi:CHAT domain-containing protein [Amycolatopsis sp. lyj-23]|uniref:CHAT domain-containing protein n=1 Tax=Amycolatopsis sp. lyj-23 TaxID=2789283 RepID=UPI00397E5947
MLLHAIAALLERSSFGTAGARELRDRTSPELANAIVERASREQGAMVPGTQSPPSENEHYGNHPHGEARAREDELAADSSVADRSAIVEDWVISGWAHLKLGNVTKAREELTRALALAERFGLPHVAASVQWTLGLLEVRIGDVPEALRRYELSERSYRAIDAEIPSGLRLAQARALLLAGLADEAAYHLDDLIDSFDGDRSGDSDLAKAQLDRASAALVTGEFNVARKMAAVAAKALTRNGCPTCTANARLTQLRAEVAQSLQTGSVPTRLITRALSVADSMSAAALNGYAATARMLAVRLDIRCGNLTRAAETLALVPRPGQLSPIDHRTLRRLCRAELALARGQRAKALTEVRAGLTEFEAVRDRMGEQDLVSGTALHTQELADLGNMLMLQRADPRRLWVWLERTRAQTFRYEPLSAETDPEQADRVAEVRNLGQAIREAQHDGRPIAGLRAKYNERLRDARRLGWRSGRWGRPRPITALNDVFAQLGERAMITFAAAKDDLVAVILAGGESRVVRLGSAQAAAEAARMLNVDLDALAPDNLPERLAEVVLASAYRQAGRLHAQLIEPLIDLIGDRELVIIPTVELFAVPWGVLSGLQRRPTVVASSAAMWFEAERVNLLRSGEAVLVRGPGLAGARGELDKLTSHHPMATQLTGTAASVESVLHAMEGATLVHIAAHGAHEPENALFSRLELSDGALFGHEMSRLRPPPQHVVFSSCELPMNHLRPGDDPVGFAGTLLDAGARTVIAPVSRVGDIASAVAIDDYYRALSAGKPPAQALAEAIAIDPFRRPFVCFGAG